MKAGTQLYRIHRSSNGPWYFDGSGDGRLDPAGTPGRGACYWAEDPLGAWVEVFRTRMILTPDDVSERRLTELTLDADKRLPDLTTRQALRAGVTAAVTAGADYTDSLALADSLQGVRGWSGRREEPGASRLPDQPQGVQEGIRWRLRHDREQVLIGVALFGDEGAATRRRRKHLPPSRTRPIPISLVNRAANGYCYEVLVPPAS